MYRLRVALLAVAALSVLAGVAPADADEVTLTSEDGSIGIEGELLSYDGDFYRIASAYGVLTVDAARVVCTGAACPEPGVYVAELMISGAAAATERLVPALLEAFADGQGHDWVRQEEDATHFLYVLSDPDAEAEIARIRFRVTTTAEGFADLVAEQADIAVAFREPTAEERVRAVEAGIGDLGLPARARLLALDAFVPVTGAGAAPAAITLADLAGLLSGRVGTWADLGGDDSPVAVHLPPPGSETVRGIKEMVLSPEGNDFADDVTHHADPESLALALDSDPGALGLVRLSDAGDLRVLPIAGSCGAAIAPRPKAVKAEDYPFVAPHYLHTPRRRLPRVARAFLAFTASPEAQEVIRDLGFTDLTLESTPASAQGERLARAIVSAGGEVGLNGLQRLAEALAGAERLTPTFRFEDGSADLDAPSRSNVALVAEAIGRGDFDGATLLAAGFSDGMGGAAANLALSRERAEAVRDALGAALPPGAADRVTITAEGFGEALPIACDEDAWGRRVNRRVELWQLQR